MEEIEAQVREARGIGADGAAKKSDGAKAPAQDIEEVPEDEE